MRLAQKNPKNEWQIEGWYVLNYAWAMLAGKAGILPVSGLYLRILHWFGKEKRQQTKRRTAKKTIERSNEMMKFHRSNQKTTQTQASPQDSNNTRRIIMKLQNSKFRHASQRWNRSSQAIVMKVAANVSNRNGQQTNKNKWSKKATKLRANLRMCWAYR